jgi:hypothetical protein
MINGNPKKPPSSSGTELPEMPSHDKLPAFNNPAKPEGSGVPDSYKKDAHSGANVMWRAKVKGQKTLADDIPLHVSLKTFDNPSDIPHDEIHQKVKELGIQRPDPKKLKVVPEIFQSPRTGQSYYMLKLHNTDPAYAKFNEHFKGRGITHEKAPGGFMGHITVNKDLFDKVKKEGIRPEELEFSPLMIEHGANNPTHLFQDSQSHKDASDDITPKKLNPVPNGMKKSEEKNEESIKIDHSKKLKIEDSLKELEEKSISDIQKETAWKWAGRAAAAYEKLAETGDWKWENDAEEYRHEAVEHAALIGDVHPDVLEEIHRSLKKYRNVSVKDAKEINKKEEFLSKPYSSEAQRRWAHTKAGLDALGGESGVHEWDEATKGKKLPEKVKKSEEPLAKGIAQKLGTAAAMVGALSGHPNTSHAPNQPNPQVQQNAYSRDRMLNAISQVESSGGQNKTHLPIPGQMHHGESAMGSFGITPVIARETIKMDPNLKRDHAKAAMLHGSDMEHYIQDNPGLERAIAVRHLNRLEHHFGQDPATIGFAWNQGISGAKQKIKSGVDPKKHWHGSKVLEAYNKGK